MEVSVTIRCSMLSSYQDCPRRAAAKQWPALISDAGFSLERNLVSVGAAVGTATHKAGEAALAEKKISGMLLPFNDCLEQALCLFDEEISDGVEWDATTGNRDTSQKQIKRMSMAYYFGPAQEIFPAEIETKMVGSLGDGFLLTGHADLITAESTIHDTKTGVANRPHWGQLGGYSLLRLANGHSVSGLVCDFIKRCALAKPQEPVLRIEYDDATARAFAVSVVKRIKADIARFMETGDENSFLANPMSMLCGRKYCPAAGTNFCRLGM